MSDLLGHCGPNQKSNSSNINKLDSDSIIEKSKIDNSVNTEDVRKLSKSSSRPNHQTQKQ